MFNRLVDYTENQMKLKQLIASLNVQVLNPQDVEITGLCNDSRKCKPNDLFFAKKGDAHIDEALAAGAVAIVATSSAPHHVPQIITDNIQHLEMQLVKRFFDEPASKLKMIGITGTNGKTTTSYLIKHVLGDCGLIGTIETIIGDKHYPAKLTTPDPITLHQRLAEMVNAQQTACVMEVSSHGLEQNRVAGIDFDIGIYTNLSQDHLDYHHTMDRYAQAKAKLFASLLPVATAIINQDCPYHILMTSDATTMTYGVDTTAHLRAFDVVLSPTNMAFTLVHGKQQKRMTCPLIGRFNVYNWLAAIVVALQSGLSLDHIAAKLKTFPGVPGRMEQIPNTRGIHVFVDYAHTPDALKNVLTTLREITSGRLLTLFGCGGDRDHEKRPYMGAVATDLSDHAIITNDNPRTENPKNICEQILAGCTILPDVELEREKAIAKLLAMAEPGDTVLIAGKGHESTQTLATGTRPFSDRLIATLHLNPDKP